MKPNDLRLSLTFLFCLFLISPDAWSKSDNGRGHSPYPERAENETLPALSDFCNEIGQRLHGLRHMNEQVWFLYDQNNDAIVETYDPDLCTIYSNLYVKTCTLIESLKSYSASTCPNGNRLDWSRERSSKTYRSCKAGCPDRVR